MPFQLVYAPLPQGPNTAEAVGVACPPVTETELLTLVGKGEMAYAIFNCDNGDEQFLRIYCDGIQQRPRYSPGNFNAYGFTATTPGFSLTRYAVGAASTVLYTIAYRFNAEIRFTCYNSHAANTYTCQLYVSAAIYQA